MLSQDIMTALAAYIPSMILKTNIDPSTLSLTTPDFIIRDDGPSIPFHATIEDAAHDPPLPPMGWICTPLHKALLELDEAERRAFVFVKASEEIKGDDGVKSSLKDVWILNPKNVKKGQNSITTSVLGAITTVKYRGLLEIPLRCDFEKIAVYADPRSSIFKDKGIDTCAGGWDNRVFDVDRSASPLFGVPFQVTNLIAYEGEGEELKVWIGVRGRTKSYEPLGWDMVANGGISAGMTEYEAVLMEAQEEAGFSEALIKTRAKLLCVAELIWTKEGRGTFYTRYVREMKLDPKAEDYQVPKCLTDEVEEHMLVSWRKVLDRILHPEQGHVTAPGMWLYFFHRHGLIPDTPETKDFFKLWETKVEVVAKPNPGLMTK